MQEAKSWINFPNSGFDVVADVSPRPPHLPCHFSRLSWLNANFPPTNGVNVSGGSGPFSDNFQPTSDNETSDGFLSNAQPIDEQDLPLMKPSMNDARDVKDLFSDLAF